MPTADTQAQVVIESYTKGIFSTFHAGSNSGITQPGMSTPANGAATIDNTYGCCADPNTGWLTPLPRKQVGATTTLPGSTANYVSGRVEMRALDAISIGPLHRSATPGVAHPSLTNSWYEGEAINIIYHFMYNSGLGGTDADYFVGRFWDPSFGSKFDWLYFKSSYIGGAATVVPYTLPMAKLLTGKTDVSGSTVPVAAGDADSVVGWMVRCRDGLSTATGAVNAADQLSGITFGTDNANGWNWPPGSGDSSAAWGIMDNVLSGSATAKLIGTANGNGFFAHQGRVVLVDVLLSSFYKFTNQTPGFIVGEWFRFTPVEQWYSTAVADGWGKLEVMPEVPGGIGAIMSLNASDLFVVKHQGGGALIRGSLTDPTVIRLTNIESTAGVQTDPVLVPGLGVVYGTRSGVFAFDGQVTTKKLNTQIDGQFWRWYDPTKWDPMENGGKFAYVNPWIAVPNDYLYDTRTESWWRICDPEGHNAYNMYMAGQRTNRLYAVPNKVDQTYNTAFDYYSLDTLALSYSWQSQPLFESITQVLSFSTIDLVAQVAPNSTGNSITVTFTGYDSDGSPITPVSEKFALTTNPGPQFFERNMHPEFQGRYVQVRIEASAETGAAPTVGPLTLGIRPERTPPRA